MIRCPSCGKRLRDGAPSCAVHGVPPPAPPPAEAPIPFVVPDPDLEAYRIRRLLGQGGFGAVFAADRISDGQTAAIKVARADNATAGECLSREAAALAAIGPPHVPILFETGKLADGAVYAVMEFVRAPILADRMAELDGPMPVDEFGRYALAMLAVIEAAHGKGLVHCDLKPENIFVDDAFGAKLFDFGLVRRVGDKPSESTREEAPAGTPEYMSPEQCEGRVDLDARSDLYALGVIFYEMLAGGPPFWGKSAEVQQNHRSRRPPALGRRAPMAVALEEAVMRCLAKDPERRFASATELRKALQAGLVAERARTETLAAEPAAPVEAAPAAGSAAAGAKPAAAKPAAPPRERRTVALLFFESKADVAAVREAMTSVGAQLAHTAGAQYVLAFGHELGDNPTRAAANAAEMVVARGLTKRALVDLASVSVQARPDGSRRFQSPLFAKKEQYPSEANPLGVLLSPAALEVLPDIPSEPVPARPGVMLLKKATLATTERTTTRMGVAPLVGREDVLRALLEAARAATGNTTPTITTLIGEAGYGKTHLAQMLVQHLEVLPKIQTLFVRAKEVLGGAGEQTTREMYARTLALPDEPPADLGRALLADQLGADVAREVWGGVAVTMGWAPPEHPELRALAAAPGALRSAAARAAGEALRQMARERPLAVVVEDAHFVDETALDALEYATLKEADCPIWVCVVGRPAFGRGRTAWASRAARKQDLALPALEPSAAAELARRLLSPAENVPQSALARLAERTQGIPMLLVELVRGLKRDGLVRKSEKGNSWYLATDELERLPDLPLVQWLSSRETESLPPDLLAHARLASMLGVEFSADELEGVLQELERLGAAAETQLDASIGLRRLSESGILVRHRGGRVGFRHSLLRDTVYQSVPAAQRETIHRAAFDYFRRQDRLPEAQRLPPMAFHASRSGLVEEAGKLYLELASRTLARHAYLDAELLFRNALENLPKEDDLGHITASKGRGMMRFRLGRHEDALKDFNVALERARKVEAVQAQIDILLDEGIVLDWSMDWPRSAAVAEEAGLAQGALRTPLTDARLHMGRGRTFLRQDKLPEAAAAMEEAIEVAGALGEEGYEPYANAMSMLAWALACMSRYEDSERAFTRCVTVFEEHGDMIGLAGALQNRCTLSFLTNNIERVLADYKRVIQIARECGFPISECLATKDLGEIYFLLGRPKEAEPYAQRGIDMYMATLGETASRVFNAQMLMARIKWYEGDLQAASEVARKIRDGQAAAQAAGQNDSLLTPGELVLIEMVDLALRRAADDEFDALVGKARDLTLQAMDIVEIMEFKALAALRAGRRADGVRLLEAAFTEADKNARLVADRIRRQLEQAAALAAS